MFGGRNTLEVAAKNERVNDGKRRRVAAPPRRHVHRTDEVQLNPAHVRAARDASHHEYTRSCINERDKRLFAGKGIVMTRGGRRLAPSEHMRVFLTRDASRMARAANEVINLLGVVPVMFRRERIGGLGPDSIVPYVPAIDTFALTTYSEDGVQKYNVYRSAPSDTDSIYGERIADAIVLDGYGFEPELDGSLTSNYYVISTRLRMLAELTNLAMRAERIASNPPLITEYNASVETARKTSYGSKPFVGSATPTGDEGADDGCVQRIRASRARNAEQARAHRRLMQEWGRLNGINHRTAFRLGADSKVDDPTRSSFVSSGVNPLGEEMPWLNHFALGAERHLVTAQMPHTRSDLVAIGNQARAIVCSVLNTPEAVVSASSHVRAGVEAASRAMDNNVAAWAAIDSSILTRAYEHSLGVTDLRHYLRAMALRRHGAKRSSIISEADVVSAKRKLSVVLEFDLMPASTPERLERLYAWGLLSDDRFGSSMLRLEGFSHDDLETGNQLVLTDDERRQLVVGSTPAPSDAASDDDDDDEPPIDTKRQKK